MTKLGMVTQTVENHVSMGSATPPSEGGGAPASPNFCDSYLRLYDLTSSYQVRYGN